MQVSYVTESKNEPDFFKVTATKTQNIKRCLICHQSKIMVAADGIMKEIYSLESAGN
jgi:hypothetical protein